MRARLRSRTAVLVIATVAILAISATVVVASHDFSDVPNSNIYHSAVSYIVDRGVTAGCGGGKYCPDKTVTRGQMAAFLKNAINAATPSRRNVNGSVGALDLDADPEVCEETSNYTPAYAQQVLFTGKVSVVPAAAAPTLSYWAYPAYSTNGGTTWTTLDAGTDPYSAESQASGAGSDTSLAVSGVMNLTAGTNYRFGITIIGVEATTGDGTADSASGGWCNLITLIFNRNA